VRTSFGVGNASAGFGPSNWPRDVTSRIRDVFRRLREANLRLNPEECQFFNMELLYLGHRVTSEGIGTDPEKVAAIAELEPPSTVKELRQT